MQLLNKGKGLLIFNYHVPFCTARVLVPLLFTLFFIHHSDNICYAVLSFMQFVSCGDISLISSYEKVENCVYTSTLLRKCGGGGSKILNPMNRCSKWKLTHAEVPYIYLQFPCLVMLIW
jgi:hypothetical protein